MSCDQRKELVIVGGVWSRAGSSMFNELDTMSLASGSLRIHRYSLDPALGLHLVSRVGL